MGSSRDVSMLNPAWIPTSNVKYQEYHKKVLIDSFFSPSNQHKFLVTVYVKKSSVARNQTDDPHKTYELKYGWFGILHAIDTK